MAFRLLPAIQQVFSNLGEVGTGFKLKTYQTLTVTPLATYSDEGLTTPNANPASGATTGNQIADSAGRFGDMWVDDLSNYKIVLTDENDVTIDTVDPVGGMSSNSLTAFNPIPEAFWGTTAGTSSAYTLDSNVDISGVGYQDTQIFEVDFHIENAANPTMAIDGLSALNLKKKTGQGTKVGLLAGDVNGTHLIRNDGTDLIVLNPRTQLLYLGEPPTIAVSTNTLTLTDVASSYNVNTGSSAQTINTISGLVSGQTAWIGISSNSNSATFTSGVGNVVNTSGNSVILSSINDKIQVYNDGTNVLIISVKTSGSSPLQLLQTQTASSSSQLAFTTLISSQYSKYVFEFIDIVPATDNAGFQSQLSVNGGSSYISANYLGSNWASSSTDAIASYVASTSVINFCGNFATDANWGTDSAAGKGLSGKLTLYNPSSSTTNKRISYDEVVYTTALGYFAKTAGGIICNNSTTAVNAIKFFFSSGNIASGTIKMYGVL